MLYALGHRPAIGAVGASTICFASFAFNFGQGLWGILEVAASTAPLLARSRLRHRLRTDAGVLQARMTTAVGGCRAAAAAATTAGSKRSAMRIRDLAGGTSDDADASGADAEPLHRAVRMAAVDVDPPIQEHAAATHGESARCRPKPVAVATRHRSSPAHARTARSLLFRRFGVLDAPHDPSKRAPSPRSAWSASAAPRPSSIPNAS